MPHRVIAIRAHEERQAWKEPPDGVGLELRREDASAGGPPDELLAPDRTGTPHCRPLAGRYGQRPWVAEIHHIRNLLADQPPGGPVDGGERKSHQQGDPGSGRAPTHRHPCLWLPLVEHERCGDSRHLAGAAADQVGRPGHDQLGGQHPGRCLCDRPGPLAARRQRSIAGKRHNDKRGCHRGTTVS